MRSTLFPSFLILSALIGCAPGDGIRNFGHTTLFVTAGNTMDDGTVTSISVSIGIAGGAPDSCPIAKSDLKGTVNGKPLTVVALGNEGGFGPCGDPSLTGPVSGTGPLDIRVSDSSGEMRATFATSFEKRTLTMVEPTDGKLYINDRVTMRHSPASDELVAGQYLTMGFATIWWGAPATQDGELVSFTVPEVRASYIGTDSLSWFGASNAQNTSCTGADSCTLQVLWAAPSFDVQLVLEERTAPACYECGCQYSDGSTFNLWSADESDAFVPSRCSTIQCDHATKENLPATGATCVARSALGVQVAWDHDPGKFSKKPPPP